MEKIAIIAGRGKFPLLFAKEAKSKGFDLVILAVKGDTSWAIKRFSDKVYWIGIAQFKKIFEILEKEAIGKIVMAGQVNPQHLFSKKINQDTELKKILDEIQNKKADTIFGAIAREIEKRNVELLDSSTFLSGYLPKKGVLTKREPDFKQWEDIYFGLDIAKMMGALDIGQTVAIKNKAIVAVEAFEGTDATILRAGRIAREGTVIIKVSKPKQDMRFDIPVVGLETIKNLIRAKARCLAIEAEKTLFIDQEESVSLADKKDIAITAI